MNACKGLAGLIFGHHFIKCKDETHTPVNTSSNQLRKEALETYMERTAMFYEDEVEKISNAFPIETTELLSSKTTACVCTRCGEVKKFTD